MKKLIFLLLVLLVAVLSVACETTKAEPPPPPSAEAPADERYYCTTPESDSGKTWGTAQICYDTQVYTLSVTVLGEMSSNQTVSGSFSGSSYGGTGFSSGRMWTDGKGILPVMINSINPAPDPAFGNWLDTSLPYVLKTTDLGLLGVPAGATTTVICNHDVEALSPVFTGQTFTKNRMTHELDVCRMVTKNFIPAP